MSNYHIVRVSPVVNLSIRNQIAAEKRYDDMSYDALLDELLSQQYTYTDVFKHEMERLGNRCEEILFDVEKLQKKWAKENGLDIAEGQIWQLKIALAQLKALNPDVVYIQGFTRIQAKDVEAIKAHIPNLKKVVVHSGFPNGDHTVTQDTLVLGAFPCIQKRFEALGCDARLMYHCFDERLLERLPATKKAIPFSFNGTSGFGYGEGHKTRYWELLKLSYHSQLECWVDDISPFNSKESNDNPFVSQPLKQHFYDDFEGDFTDYPAPFTPLRNLLAEGKVHPPVYGLDYFQVLKDSLVTFQRHTNAMFHEVGAMRVFQATGVGSCLLTNSGTNLADLFEDGTEVVTYSCLQECIEKADFLARNPAKAKEIANNGQRKTREKHSARVRYEQAHEYILEVLR